MRTNFVVNSLYTKNSFINIYNLNNDISVVYNPVSERSNYYPNKISQQNTIYLMHVGGMTKWRDQKTIIYALNILNTSQSQVRYKLFLIGDGAERTNLEELCEQLEVSDYVFFEGYKTDLDFYYKKSHIYINSAVEEGFGIATAEAMLAGKTTIVADRSANIELISNLDNGFHYRASDPTDLAKVILDLNQQDESVISQMQFKARMTIENKFNKNNYAYNIQNILINLK